MNLKKMRTICNKYFRVSVMIILALFIPVSTFAAKYDLLISTYSGKNAIINISTSEFKDNAFTVSLKINWVDKALKQVKDEISILAVNKKRLHFHPADVLNTFGDIHFSAGSSVIRLC